MAQYHDMTKAEDRARYRAECQAEIKAIDEGRWPRNTNDWMRHGTTRYFPDKKAKAQWVRAIQVWMIDYIDGWEARNPPGSPMNPNPNNG